MTTTKYPEAAANADRLLPERFAQLYEGDPSGFCRALERVCHSVLPARSIAERFAIKSKPGLDYASLGTEFGVLNFYQMLIRLGGYEQVLELGSFIGVSTLFLAEAVGPDGYVTSVESGEEFYRLAVFNIANNGMDDRVTLICDDALAVLERMAAHGRDRTYDLILMDAAKQLYGAMLAPALACLAPDGLLLVDDVFMSGDTLNHRPTTKKGKGVAELLAGVAALGPEYERVILPIGNGLLMIRRGG